MPGTFRSWSALALLPLLSCASEPSGPAGAAGRAARVEALQALEGNSGPHDVALQADLLDDPDVVVRWTAAKNLMRLSPKATRDPIIDRISRFTPQGLWLGLEVLRRANANVPPDRLAFLIPIQKALEGNDGSTRENAREYWNGRIALLATRVLLNSSQPAAALELIPRFCPTRALEEAAQLAATARRPAVVDHIRRTYRGGQPFDSFTTRLICLCLEEPGMWTRARTRAMGSVLFDALGSVDSPGVIDEVFASLHRKELSVDDRYRILEAVMRNPLVTPGRLARSLDAEEDGDLLRGFVQKLFYGVEYESTSSAFRDPGALGAFLDVRHDWICQEAAAHVVHRRVEPHLERAVRVLREAPQVLLSCDAVRRVDQADPTLARLLLERCVRSGKADRRTLEVLAPVAIRRGHREIVAEICKALGQVPEESPYVLKLLAESARPEDRGTLRLASHSGDPSLRRLAYRGLSRLGDREALALLFAYPQEGEDWSLRQEARRVVSDLESRFRKDILATAVKEAWKSAPSTFLLHVAGELRDASLKEILMEELQKKAGSPAAARTLSDLPGDDTMRALHDALRHEDDEVRRAAIESLAVLEDPDLMAHLREALAAADTFPNLTRLYATQVLYNLGTQEALDALLTAGRSGTWDELYRVTRILLRIASDRPETLGMIGRLIEEHAFDLSHEEGLRSYIRAHPALLPYVLRGTKSVNPAIRARSTDLLACWPDPECPRRLATLLEDPDEEVQGRALGSLGTLGSTLGVERALELLSGASDRVSQAAAIYLAQVAPERTLPLLRSLLSRRRTQAMQGLYGIRSAEAIDLILANAWQVSERYLGGSYSPTFALHADLPGKKSLAEWEEWWADHWKDPPFAAEPVEHSIQLREEPPFSEVTIRSFPVIREWRGAALEAVEAPVEFLVNDAHGWKELWKKLRMPVPAADLGRHTAVVAILPDPSPLQDRFHPFGPKILGCTHEDDLTRIYVARFMGGVNYPISVDFTGGRWHILLVPKIAGRVEFLTRTAGREE